MSLDEQEEWTLVACTTCGSLVREKVDEDGTPSYRPLLERGREVDQPGERIVKMFRPVFSGRDQNGIQITLYKHATREDEVWIDPGDGEVRALPRGVEVYAWHNTDTGMYQIQVNSTVWSGTAIGERWHLMDEL